ncbi:MAG: ATP-binding protein, partial [Spirochaetota bacterium]
NERWLSTTKVPLRDNEGNITGIVGIGRDITEHKKADERLRQQYNRMKLLNDITRAINEKLDLDSVFRVLLGQLEDHLPVDFGCIGLFDPSGKNIAVHTIGTKSKSSASRMGIKNESQIHLEQNDLQKCSHGHLVYKPNTRKTSAPITKKFFNAGIHSTVIAPLVVEKRMLGVLITGREGRDAFSSGECEFLRLLCEHTALAVHQKQLYSELHNTHRELQQTQDAMLQQARLRALGQMASGIAHDISNSLSPIVGYPDILLESEPGLSDRARKYLEILKTAGMDIAETVDRMREFYRMRDSNEKLLPVQVNKVIGQAINLTRPRWEDMPHEKGLAIEVKTELQDNLPPIMGIESDIRESLTNLIINAVDAMPEGGALTLRTRKRASTIVIEVIDTGIGMDEETEQHCMEPFYTTKNEQGTGLGLGIVYGMLQRHEGKAEIESEPGKGTTIRLFFPIGKPSEIKEKESPGKVLPGLRVLCIDDESSLRELIKEILENMGHAVEAADGGRAGIDAFYSARKEKKPFDVIITDLGMPGVDGRRVLNTVKEESSATPVILLTGWGEGKYNEEEATWKADEVLGKPPTINDLKRALQKVMKASD